MDIDERIQFWEKEIERAEQYDFFFDIQSMREVIEIVKQQQKELERLEKQMENVIYTDTDYTPKPYRTIKID